MAERSSAQLHGTGSVCLPRAARLTIAEPAPETGWMKWHACGMALLLALALGGCSAIRTLYNQADHVVAWRVNDYFDLDAAQKRSFELRLRSLHAWHRKHQLRDYALFLATAEQRLHRGPVPDDADWIREQIRVQSLALLAQAHEDVATLLASLTDRQIEHARQKFDRDNRKFAQERGAGAPPEEQRRLRAALDIAQIEHWSGPLDREQRSRIAMLSAQLPLDADVRHSERIRRQQEFLGLLAQRKDAERFRTRLHRWLLDWDASRPTEHRLALDHHALARATMLVGIYSELKPGQRLKVLERLRWYTDAMRDLSVA